MLRCFQGEEKGCIGNKCVKTVDQKNIVLQNIGLYLGFLLMSEIKLFFCMRNHKEQWLIIAQKFPVLRPSIDPVVILCSLKVFV